MRPKVCEFLAFFFLLPLLRVPSVVSSRSMTATNNADRATRPAAAPTNYDLIIIGSGFAGLSAAKRAKEKGITNVLMLDARPRVGGRTFTQTLNIQLPADAPSPPIIDLGAAWIHGVMSRSGVPNPMVALSREAGLPTYNVPETGRSFDPQGKEDTSSWDTTYEDMYTRYTAYYNRYLDGAVPKFRPADRDSLQRVADNFIASQKKPLTAMQKDALNQYLATEIVLDYSADLAQLSAIYSNEDLNWGGPDALPGRGYSALVEYLVRTANVTIQLSNVVDIINFRQAAQGVVAVSGRSLAPGGGTFTFTAKAVINTMPLGYLQAQLSRVPAPLFDPALPSSQVTAIRALGMGLLDKIILVWPNSDWWSKVFAAAWITIRNTTTPGVFSEFYNLAATPAKLPVIVGFNGGSPAFAIEELSDDAIITSALNTLQKVLPAGTTIPPYAQAIVTRWGKDPWTHGAYSYSKVGMKASSRSTAFAAVGSGRVRFAGEHTHSLYPATVHGAYLTGIREADAVAKLLGR